MMLDLSKLRRSDLNCAVVPGGLRFGDTFGIQKYLCWQVCPPCPRCSRAKCDQQGVACAERRHTAESPLPAYPGGTFAGGNLMSRYPPNPGSWPRLMRAETAAAYVDERSVDAFGDRWVNYGQCLSDCWERVSDGSRRISTLQSIEHPRAH